MSMPRLLCAVTIFRSEILVHLLALQTVVVEIVLRLLFQRDSRQQHYINSKPHPGIMCKRSLSGPESPGKRIRVAEQAKIGTVPSPFDDLPDDILISIMAALNRSANSTTDLINAGMTCKRMADISTHPEVVVSASLPALTLPARHWSPAYHSLLAQAAELGNFEASYLLGMIEFYCLDNTKEGLKLLVDSAKAGYAPALHSLGIIHFNGSGGCSSERQLAMGVVLCSSAAKQGHVEALRELGHCLQDGYGIQRNVTEGKQFLLEANRQELSNQPLPLHSCGGTPTRFNIPASLAGLVHQLQFLESAHHLRANTHVHASSSPVPSPAPAPTPSPSSADPPAMTPRPSHVDLPAVLPPPVCHKALQVAVSRLAATLSTSPPHSSTYERRRQTTTAANLSAILSILCESPLMSDFGCTVPSQPPHPANAFLLEWFQIQKRKVPGNNAKKTCGNALCGRPETRAQEFRCCSLCSVPSYCSRACQAIHWKAGHMVACQEEFELQAQGAELGEEMEIVEVVV